MHEMSIAESVLEIVQESMHKNDARKLLSVTVEIGELTAVIPESLEFCFQAITENSAYKGADLKIVNVPLQGLCRKCDTEFHIEKYQFICPACQSNDVKVTGGQELNVTELEVE
ncbi:MAG: hydrogenase maturation nickel metallochaperone HypA [Calditrichia bacterium]